MTAATSTPVRRRQRRTYPVVVSYRAPVAAPDLTARGTAARRRAVFGPDGVAVTKAGGKG